MDPLADLIRADGSTATAVPALAANRPQTAAPSSAESVASTAALSEQPTAMLPNVGANQSLAARAASTVQRSGPVVQRVSWDSEPTTSTARAVSYTHLTVGNLVVGAGASYRFKAGESAFEQVRGR